MKKILFPTAYAAQSKVAFRYALKLAQYFEASITLVHIYEGATTSLTSTGALVGEELKRFAVEQQSREMAKLEQFANEFSSKQYHQIALDFIATDGDTIRQLLDIQSENDFDLIVMGTKKHRTLQRILGNTTYSLIDEAKCPLLLIPPDAPFTNIKRILYGTAFKTGDLKTVDYLLDWCLVFNGKLDLLHVYRKENSIDANNKMELFIKSFDKERASGIIKTNLVEGKISQALNQQIQSTGADLLAIHRRKQGFFEKIIDGSLTKTLSENIQTPLLVLK